MRNLVFFSVFCWAVAPWAATVDSTVAALPQLGGFTQDSALVDPYENSGKTGPIQVSVDNAHPGIVIHTDGLFGTDLAIWNSPDCYKDLKPYLVDAGFNWFRFPNGSASNNYHWNGSGKYDSTGIWSPDKKEWSPGFVTQMRWRGVGKNHYGSRHPSHLTDGDSATLWWGALYDRQDPPWFYLDFGDTVRLDSVSIEWGKLRPKSFHLEVWDRAKALYPYPHQLHQNLWKPVASGMVKRGTTGSKFAARSGRYWAVRFSASDLVAQGLQ
ncbi:MAG TPA: hypothetical protein VLM37_08520, partial [Fibrobacteraceae bacterium]|nr:hypothetical protein [Fibrobacteraceae bacterium]